MKSKFLLVAILLIMVTNKALAVDLSLGPPRQVSVEIKDSTSDSFLLKWKDDKSAQEISLQDAYKEKIFTQVNIYIRQGDDISIKDITYNFIDILKNSEGLSQISLIPEQLGLLDKNIDLLESAYSFKIRHGIRMSDILGSFSILGPYSPSTSIGLIYPYNYASPWAIKELNMAENAGLITDEISTNMKETISREEFSSLMVNFYEKATNKVIDTSKAPFLDTESIGVSKAYNLGIVSGYEDKTFRPKNPITRQDIGVIILRTLKTIDPSLDTRIQVVENNEGIKDYAYESMIYLKEKQIFKGDENARLNPYQQITREESVLLLLRALNEFIS